MLNFRKLKADFSQNMLKEGKALYESGGVLSAKIVYLRSDAVRISGSVTGKHDNAYACEIEIDRVESEMIDSNCDCPYTYDCQHIAALLYHLGESFDQMVVDYSKDGNLTDCEHLDEEEKEEILTTIREAETKEEKRSGVLNQRELLSEYVGASSSLGRCPFFVSDEELQPDKASLIVIFSNFEEKAFGQKKLPQIHLALRLPHRSKPLNILNIQSFLEGAKYREPIYINGKRYFFVLESFDENNQRILKQLLEYAKPFNEGKEPFTRTGQVETEGFGLLLSYAYDLETLIAKGKPFFRGAEEEKPALPCFAVGALDQPLHYSTTPATFSFCLELINSPAVKLLVKPDVLLPCGKKVPLGQCCLLECAKPGLIVDNTYYRFLPTIRRKHLRNLVSLQDLIIPEPLFGTFIENALPQLKRFGEVVNTEVLSEFVTLPYAGQLEASCEIGYLDGELEASLYFMYDRTKVPAAPSQVELNHILPFVTDQGIVARNLSEEQAILSDLFQDFVYDDDQGVFVTKTEKRVVDFMTEVLPRNQHRVQFTCPENLLDQFVYDDTKFTLRLKESKELSCYEAKLEVKGHLAGVSVDQLWECIAANRAFIEIQAPGTGKGKGVRGKKTKVRRFLVLDLVKLAPLVQIFDELGLCKLDNHTELRPLWSLVSVDKKAYKDLDLTFSMSKKLEGIQKQLLGEKNMKPSAVPKLVKASLRNYQKEGVAWLERLRTMHLNGILADDMGLGKTLQAITAITQAKSENPEMLSVVVCPTSLIYNWKEEIHRFNPKLSVLAIDGTPAQRKKLHKKIKNYDVIVTSYSLMQKDIDTYKNLFFGYVILDEAQAIKNRSTRNAKSVKQLQAAHRLILTGTPIENSLNELWSLFDFLMPGLLSSYERFVEKYVRNAQTDTEDQMITLRKKVSPFILRRMKSDVLKELPPVTEIIYHCPLSEVQKELYCSYAASAREELSRLVKKEGFDKVQIHVLATLTRLKQICCHPGIFAKDEVEQGDSAKYDMLMELLSTLAEGGHKTVIFSQYTRMLQILRSDLAAQGVRFSYLDGSSRDRLGIVKEFNQDENIPIFLVSLKAGGSGLNLTGADTVIHYDMWWNPAVENQATDRVHRIGQQNNVSSYKLVTLGTIEEKILELQNRKKGLVKQVVSCDDEAIAKLTWEEVLELLQT